MMTPAKRTTSLEPFGEHIFGTSNISQQVSEKNFKKQSARYKFKCVAKLIMLLFADGNCDSNMESIAIQMGLEIDKKCK